MTGSGAAPGLGWHRKASWGNRAEPSSKEHSSMASGSVRSPRFLPWVPAPTSLSDGVWPGSWKLKQTLSCSSDVPARCLSQQWKALLRQFLSYRLWMLWIHCGLRGNSVLRLSFVNFFLWISAPAKSLPEAYTVAEFTVRPPPPLCLLHIWTLVCDLEIRLCFPCFNWKRKMINWNNTAYYSDLITFVIDHLVIWANLLPLTFHHAFLITYGPCEIVLTQSPQ